MDERVSHVNKFFAQNNLLVATIGGLIILAACDTAPSVPIPTATTALSLTLPSLTPSIPPPTLIPTATPIPPTPISSIRDSLRMAYIFEDNLYVQGGSNAPLQLTHGDRDRVPTFSNDGEKIVFLRRFIPHDLYSINADGSREQVLVSGTLLEARGLGYSKLSEIRSFAFIPSTHLVIFNTRELDELDVKMQDWNRTGSNNNDDLLTVDTDSGEIKSLL